MEEKKIWVIACIQTKNISYQEIKEACGIIQISFAADHLSGTDNHNRLIISK